MMNVYALIHIFIKICPLEQTLFTVLQYALNESNSDYALNCAN